MRWRAARSAKTLDGAMTRVATDWFRNTSWSEAIEQAFDEKLRRARRKEQYLRIQASTIAQSHPEVALRLLDRYFEMAEDFDHAQAHVDRAKAFLALNRIDDAIRSYESALERESVFPNLLTQAYLDLPYLIATRRVRSRYPRALQLLDAHKSRLMFPVDHFRWHATHALIDRDLLDSNTARTHAEQALDAAARDHSGFRYHPPVGLVTKQYDELITTLKACCAV